MAEYGHALFDTGAAISDSIDAQVTRGGTAIMAAPPRFVLGPIGDGLHNHASIEPYVSVVPPARFEAPPVARLHGLDWVVLILAIFGVCCAARLPFRTTSFLIVRLPQRRLN